MTDTTTKMTRLKVLAIVSSLVFASLLGSSMAIITTQQPITAYAQQAFTAKLTGKDEVPAVNTQATGMAHSS